MMNTRMIEINTIDDIFADDNLHILKDSNESFLSYEINRIKHIFLHYGFLGSPLSDTQLNMCIDNGFDTDTIYSMGCDVNSDYKFTALFNEYYKGIL